MMAFLTGIGGKLVMVAVILIALGAAYARYEVVLAQRDKAVADSAKWQSVSDEQKAVNQQNLAQIAKLQDDVKRASDAAEASASQAVASSAELAKIQGMIAHAKPADKGPISRVVLATIARLYPGQHNTSADHKNSGGAPAHP